MSMILVGYVVWVILCIKNQEEGTHITVVGKWGIWPVIVPPLHICPASLRFQKTRSEQSGGGTATPTTVYTPAWEMFTSRSHPGFVRVLCSKQACQQSPH